MTLGCSLHYVFPRWCRHSNCEGRLFLVPGFLPLSKLCALCSLCCTPLSPALEGKRFLHLADDEPPQKQPIKIRDDKDFFRRLTGAVSSHLMGLQVFVLSVLLFKGFLMRDFVPQLITTCSSMSVKEAHYFSLMPRCFFTFR